MIYLIQDERVYSLLLYFVVFSLAYSSHPAVHSTVLFTYCTEVLVKAYSNL